MDTKLLHILTRTPLHVGAGSSVGAIDMPVQRERHTQIPIIPGSGLKGVLRDLWNDDKSNQERLFGPDPDDKEKEHRAGELVIGEARVLCFPVRSAKGSFAWITSPLALQRYARDCASVFSVIPSVSDDECLASDGVSLEKEGKVVLEEYCFRKKPDPVPPDVLELLKKPFSNDPVWSTVSDRLVILSDGLFSYFCANACEVQQRIKINDDTGTAAEHALFNQENVPSETLFYGVVAGRTDPKAVEELREKLKTINYVIQIGGDETIGLGYCSVEIA